MNEKANMYNHLLLDFKHNCTCRRYADGYD